MKSPPPLSRANSGLKGYATPFGMSDVLGWKPKPILEEEIAGKKRPIHPLIERAFAETGRRNKTSKKEGPFHLLGSTIYSNVMLNQYHFLCTTELRIVFVQTQSQNQL
jgi:hypothetical protein